MADLSHIEKLFIFCRRGSLMRSDNESGLIADLAELGLKAARKRVEDWASAGLGDWHDVRDDETRAAAELLVRAGEAHWAADDANLLKFNKVSP